MVLLCTNSSIFIAYTKELALSKTPKPQNWPHLLDDFDFDWSIEEAKASLSSEELSHSIWILEVS